MYRYILALVLLIISGGTLDAQSTTTPTYTASTTLDLAICGNGVVESTEECDVPGENGEYSTTIAGRQCNPSCQFGAYCGDGILQTQFGEQCDDGNNEDGDFCSALCRIEPAGSGGGGSSGGGSGGGGSQTPQGDTVVSISGRGYPNQTINFLLDTESIGTVRANASGQFSFSTDASPGTATLGVWANDSAGTRSITLNNTFDVTQGAVTNVRSIILPPTIRLSRQNLSPGDTVIISGQAVPDAEVELVFNSNEITETTQSSDNGAYSLEFDTSRLRVAAHTLRARSVTGTAPLFTQSQYSSSVQLFVGVDGEATQPSDLNRDGRVNLVDFSILIFWWGGAGGDSDPPADISGNGRVGLEDFSILLFNWTG